MKGTVPAAHGFQSLLAGLAWPLGGWWCRDLVGARSTDRRRRGFVFILPGVEGRGPLNQNVALGLVDAGVPWALEIHDWTTGFWPLFAYHLRNRRRREQQAVRLAAHIVRYQDEYPGRPTFLIGHSGGGALAVAVLEQLPAGRQVTAAVLLAPALSRRYDLSQALSHTAAGVWNFYSPLDWVFLTLGTTLFGTADGKHGVSAGAWGFVPPSDAESLYRARLHQILYRRSLARDWHFGGHLGWANRAFVAHRLAGLLTSLCADPDLLLDGSCCGDSALRRSRRPRRKTRKAG